MDFYEKLLNAMVTNQSLLCIGLDPDPRLMPEIDVFQFNREIIDATSDLVCAYKPNVAFYEAMGIDGLRAMEKTVACIPEGIPVIGDAKRGDIASSSEAYARALFENFSFGAVTVNPYMGYDSIAPFIEFPGKGVFILCKTSNPGAADFQELNCVDPTSNEGARPLFELVALKAKEWNTRGNIGLVVGATYPKQLMVVRELCPELPLLIPGVGTQGGDLAETVRYGVDARGKNAVINCSRQILYASRKGDFAQAARQQAQKLRDQINEYIEAA
ncbi:MAG: orotidine-5'-phosphate decarboxylase [Chloroflexota bacterium]|nr:orotidine-5'-phosphate decarboxylase [Chloroflexota bacterium]